MNHEGTMKSDRRIRHPKHVRSQKPHSVSSTSVTNDDASVSEPHDEASRCRIRRQHRRIVKL